jgi:hypothetical protein
VVVWQHPAREREKKQPKPQKNLVSIKRRDTRSVSIYGDIKLKEDY